MPNIICNCDFEYGLYLWTHSGAVEVTYGQVHGARQPLTWMPYPSTLGQDMDDWRTTGEHLRFWWFSLGGRSPGLEVSLTYGDAGNTQQRHVISWQSDEDRQMCLARVPVDNSKPIRSFQVRNVSTECGVHFFTLEGEPARSWRPPCRAFAPWSLWPWLRGEGGRAALLPSVAPEGLLSAGPAAEAMREARLSDVDAKLQQILELLRVDKKPG